MPVACGTVDDNSCSPDSLGCELRSEERRGSVVVSQPVGDSAAHVSSV